jgi:hypothetical protein
MKTNLVTRLFLILAFMVSIFGIQQAQAARRGGGGAHLIVQRAANFGNDLIVHLAIDGRDVTNIALGHRYDGYVSGGRHTLTISPLPNPQLLPATSTRVMLRPGRTNIYMATWGGKQLILRPTKDNIPASPAPPIR